MQLFTIRETADRLGVTPRTIHTWLRQGKFPNAYKLDPEGRTSPYRIPESDIIAFEDKRHTHQPVTVQ